MHVVELCCDFPKKAEGDGRSVNEHKRFDSGFHCVEYEEGKSREGVRRRPERLHLNISGLISEILPPPVGLLKLKKS